MAEACRWRGTNRIKIFSFGLFQNTFGINRKHVRIAPDGVELALAPTERKDN